MLKKILFFFTLALIGATAYSQDFPPKSATLITDYTNTLSGKEIQGLEEELVSFNDTSSTQIAVVIMKTIGDYDISEYATQLGRKWGIGQKGKNNGVLIFVAMDQHKMAIEVGYGLEGTLPDAVAHSIIENDMKPAFRKGNYYDGLHAAADDIIKYTKGEYKADKQAGGESSSGFPVFVIIFIVFFILFLIFRNRGGGGHIIGGRGGASPFWWFLAGDILGGSGRGGGWGGGSGGGFGGGSSGGGFGGFGGGSFGGGGSSGSW